MPHIVCQTKKVSTCSEHEFANSAIPYELCIH